MFSTQTSRSVPYEAENGKCRDHNAYLQDTICCQMCPPGQYVVTPCSHSSDTVCADCEERTFTESYNYIKECILCGTCDEGQEAAYSCHTGQRVALSCHTGRRVALSWHTGQGVALLCHAGRRVAPSWHIRDINQTCSPCPAGTFKNISSAHVKCRTHRNCSASGLKEKLPGTAKSDAKCEESTESFNWKSTAISLFLTMALIFFFFILAMVCQNFQYSSMCSKLTAVFTWRFFDGESNKTRGQPLNEPPIPDQWGENLLHSSPSSPSHSGFPDHRGENEAENRREVPGVGGNEPHQIQTGMTDLPECSSGIQLMGTNVTIHGNLYIYSQPDSSPPGPSSPTGLNYPIKEENCPFLTPQQESGKESHVAVEESGTADR
uniref:Lymphotoxin beta receptor n=1 Tax=Latimeria chalumnae TaxID=7897 RepID=H3AH24_LATCH